MTHAPADLADDFARRVAERDNPPPPPSREPAAVQARLEAWLGTAHGVTNVRGRHRLGRMLLALMQHPERSTGELALAAGLPATEGRRMAVRLLGFGLTIWETRGRCRYHRLSRAGEDAVLAVVLGTAPIAEA